jgi:hypothetical protein
MVNRYGLTIAFLIDYQNTNKVKVVQWKLTDKNAIIQTNDNKRHIIPYAVVVKWFNDKGGKINAEI